MMYLFQFDIRCVFFTVFYSTCGITYSVESTVESLNKQPDLPCSKLSVMISNISTCVQIQPADKHKIVLQGGRSWKQLCWDSGHPIMMMMMMMIAFWVLHAELIKNGAQFTNYLTIYLMFVVRSTYDSDLQRANISLSNIISQFMNAVSDDLTILQVNCP